VVFVFHGCFIITIQVSIVFLSNCSHYSANDLTILGDPIISNMVFFTINRIIGFFLEVTQYMQP